jgi:magnesium-transporting ATPase (P-type)
VSSYRANPVGLLAGKRASLPTQEIIRRFQTDTARGPDRAEAAQRLNEYGLNRLPEGKKRGPLMRFLAEFGNGPVYFLVAAGFTNLMLNFWIDASIILGVVVVNALLGFIQQGRKWNA